MTDDRTRSEDMEGFSLQHNHAHFLYHLRYSTAARYCRPSQGRPEDLLANHHNPMGYHGDHVRFRADLVADDPSAPGPRYFRGWLLSRM